MALDAKTATTRWNTTTPMCMTSTTNIATTAR